MFYVYVLLSHNNQSTYVGFTSNLEKRLVAHNHLKNTGWTKRYSPWNILFSEEFENKLDAMKRERELKSGKGRDYIKKYIENNI
jgi:putative endonuclease